LINILEASRDEVVAWAYIENASSVSAAPILEPVPLVTKVSSKALVIVLSAVAKNLFIVI